MDTERSGGVRTRVQQYATIEIVEGSIVFVRVVSEPSDENYPQYLHALGEAFRSLDTFSMIFDTGDLDRFPAKYREMQARWLAETENEFMGRWLCAAFVIRNTVIRGVLMTLYWLKEPYYEHKVVASSDEAWEWTRAQMQRLRPSDSAGT